MTVKKLDEEFEKLQADWQKVVVKFMNRSDKINDKFVLTAPPGMAETMLFGLMWHVIKDRIKKYTFIKKELEMDAELEFVRSMLKKILNEDYPNALFAKEDGELVEVQKDEKITIN